MTASAWSTSGGRRWNFSKGKQAFIVQTVYTESLTNHRYRYALEQCFARSKSLAQPSIASLQALVLFLITTHYSPTSAPVNSLLALAISLALQLNLHQDPLQTSQGQSSYSTVADRTSTEIRRRLWWHIMTLDVQYAEITRTDPLISETMWTTRFPDSLNDGELDASCKLPIPPQTGKVFDPGTFAIPAAAPHGGEQENRRTDTSFALLRIEMMHVLRRQGFSEQFCANSGYNYLSTSAARIRFLEDLVQRVNQKFLQSCQGNDFLSFFERNAVKLVLSKHLMLAKQDEPARDRLRNCIKVLEAAVGLRKAHPRWAWLLRQPVELDSLELLWECLAAQSGTDQLDGDADRQHAWRLAEKAIESGERDDLAACYPMQWSRIQNLYTRAIELRSAQTQTGSQEQEN
jgi:Fungal specific transcription factor domain